MGIARPPTQHVHSAPDLHLRFALGGSMKPTRVVLIDDHTLLRAGVRALLERRGLEVVGEADNGSDAVKLALQLRADVVLMDLSMPGLNGFEATRRIAALEPAPRVLAFSGHTDLDYVRQALQAGAAGYLLKSEGPDTLEQAVRSVAHGEVWLSPSLAQRGLEDAVSGLRGAERGGELTARQREVLQLIAEGHSTKQIARRLQLSVKTVESHRAQIMTRLGIRHVAGLVRYAIRAGITSPNT